MNGSNNPPKFALQKGDQSQEAIAIHQVGVLDRHTVRFFAKSKDVPPDFIPCGGVDWCLEVLGRDVVPDYYPEFLSNYLHRKVWRSDEWPLGAKTFVKPSDRYKRFTGFVTNGGYRNKKRGPYWCSEVVKFENEWRYYVSHGKVLASGWYWGYEKGQPEAPRLTMPLPDDYCGALDFGTLVGHPETLA